MSADSPTLSDVYFAEAKKLQANCCCRALDERECWRLRYPPRIDDIFHYEELDEDDYCECACHAELGDLERELWPEELG